MLSLPWLHSTPQLSLNNAPGAWCWEHPKILGRPYPIVLFQQQPPGSAYKDLTRCGLFLSMNACQGPPGPVKVNSSRPQRNQRGSTSMPPVAPLPATTSNWRPAGRTSDALRPSRAASSSAASEHLLQQLQRGRMLDVVGQLILGHPDIVGVAAALAQRWLACYQLAPAGLVARRGGVWRDLGGLGAPAPAHPRFECRWERWWTLGGGGPAYALCAARLLMSCPMHVWRQPPARPPLAPESSGPFR